MNNLGIYAPKAFEDVTDEDWRAILEANFMSGVRLARHYLPRMKTANWGRILFISSESALQIPAEFASKIIYPAAIVAGSRHQDQAQRFLAFLKTEEAGQIFRRSGFGITQ